MLCTGDRSVAVSAKKLHFFENREKFMKKWVVLLLLASLAVSGCNTVAGVGKDLERAGEAIQDISR